jgi:hypothetical protein
MSRRTARLLLLAASAALAAPASAADPAPDGHWPQWRGPDRTNVSTEAGLLKEWPAGGPPLAWRADGLGDGVPSVAVAGGQVYVLGNRAELIRLLRACSSCHVAVAWASVGFKAFDLLAKNANKIERMSSAEASECRLLQTCARLQRDRKRPTWPGRTKARKTNTAVTNFR